MAQTLQANKLVSFPLPIPTISLPVIKAVLLLTVLLFSNSNSLAQFSQQWVSSPLKSGAAAADNFSCQVVDTQNNLITVSYNGVNRENTRIALYKHNANGQKLWSTVYTDGASLWDTPTAAKTDKDGNIYLLAWSQLTQDEGRALIAKYNAAGDKVWMVPIGANPGSHGFAVTDNGEVFVIATVKEASGGDAPQIIKLDATGKTAWSQNFIGSDGEGGTPGALALDQAGNLYVAGTLYVSPGYPKQPYYVARLVKYSAQSGAKLFTGQYATASIPFNMDYESMRQVLVAPSGNVYLVSQRSGLYMYQVIVYKISGGRELEWARAAGETDESTHMQAVLSTEEQLTLLCRELKYRDVWDYFLTAYDNQGQRQYYHTYNSYIPETNNIRRVVPEGVGLAPNGSVALIGSRDYVQKPPAFYMDPIVIEPARETIILYSSSGEQTWQETSSGAGARSNGMALDFMSVGSFYLAGTQTADAQLVAARYTGCGGFTVTAGQDKTICAGGEVRLEASAATTYSWSPAEGLSSTTVANPLARPAQTTTYTVTATNAAGCTSTAQVTVKVNPLPQASIAAAGNLTICEGSNVTLKAVKGPGEYSLQWLYNGQEISGATTDLFVATVAGNYALRVTAGNCSQTSPAVEVKVVLAIANNTLSGNQTVCAGATPQLISGETPAGGNGTFAYQWQRSINGTDFTDIAGATGKDYQPGLQLVSTWFRRTVSSGSCFSASITAKVTLVERPTVTLAAFGQTCQTATAFALTGGFPEGGTYSGNGVSNGMFNPAVAGAGTHTITYRYTNAGGCTVSITQPIVVEASCTVTSIPEAELQFPVTIYPNPTAATVHIEMQLPNRAALELRLTDVSGRVLHDTTHEQPPLEFSKTLDLSKYPRGLYLLQVKTRQGVLQRKIIVK
ncbi:T9SS type A sorting domain-containing protein [uncultured Pontibacter sp.]|uniref:T9SS type A sorting domain-containing protein n=1 Tax=uncultured Pontibacter sp. TaxID=453356 RepID=UPI00261AC8AC|nr:T9SS type A sorting domain-containing protein [uncultured Pontibacter sp.]